MANSVDNGFVKQYESEVHEAYQRMGSKLRNCVRNKGNVKGSTTTFQKIGKGTAAQKTRNGKVPVMNVDHTPVTCTLSDWYAGDYVDKLDEYKINHDERQVLVNAGSYALGRKTDDLIITQLDTCTSQIATGATGMTRDKFLKGIETLGNKDVPVDDGQLYCVIGFQQWSDLMKITEFNNADYVGKDDLPWKGKGMMAKYWGPAMVFTMTGLPLASTTRSNYMFHSSAIGHANGAEVQTDITWHGDYAAHFINNMMSQGAVLIDDDGVIEILCTET